MEVDSNATSEKGKSAEDDNGDVLGIIISLMDSLKLGVSFFLQRMSVEIVEPLAYA